MTTYAEKLRDPRWQKKRLEILERDKYTCRHCDSVKKTLHIHHFYYKKDTDPWDYSDETLITLCKDCHEFVAELQRMFWDDVIAEKGTQFLMWMLNSVYFDEVVYKRYQKEERELEAHFAKERLKPRKYIDDKNLPF